MKFLDTEIAPMGMGCWPIGGAMFSGDQSLGYTNVNDAESTRTIHAALDAGIQLFDTAAVYGAGHAERLLGRALKGRSDAIIVTKIGTAIDEESKQLLGNEFEPETVIPAIDRCLKRLQRDQIDAVLLHQNELALDIAEPIFDEMEKARQAGKVRAYGWSTDMSVGLAAVAGREGFAVVEHAMNVVLDTPRIQEVAQREGLHALIRSPLGMGLLTGKYDANSVMAGDDIRSTANPKTSYFVDARPNRDLLAQRDAVRDLLTTGGRTLVQGALGWLWGKSDQNIPLPGVRTVEQLSGVAGALQHGPLPESVMAEIETLIDRSVIDATETPR